MGLVVVKTIFNPFLYEWNRFPYNWQEFVTPRNITTVICIILIIIGIINLHDLQYKSKGSSDVLPQKITKIETENNEFISLFLTLLSLFIFDFDTYRDVLLFIILH